MIHALFQQYGPKNRQQQQQHKSIARRGAGHHHPRMRFVRSIVVILFLGIVFLFLYVYIRIIILHLSHSQPSDTLLLLSSSASNQKPSIIAKFLSTVRKSPSDNSIENQHVYYFRRIAVELAKYQPSDILYELNEYDPFGVRKVIQLIQTAELQNKNQTISLSQLKSIFPCPSLHSTGTTGSKTENQYPSKINHRITYPELRNMTKLVQYQQQLLDILNENKRKDDNVHYFIYFQHLRKAGGTHFCTIAQQNIPRQYVPKYYCMPDYYWIPEAYTKSSVKHTKYEACAGCLHRYSNTEIIQNMQQYIIAGNEWDNFNVQHHFDLPAIYTTSFRQPLHRFVSQYRFECVEARGCTAKTIDSYYIKRRDLYNIYTSTFSDVNQQASFADADTPWAAQERSKAIAIAYDTILQFHLVLVMELLPYSEQLVQNVLGFRDTSILSKRVRPHNTGTKFRTDSWTPEQYLTKEQYTKMSESLALDEILYDVARRIFLERLVCSTSAAQ